MSLTADEFFYVDPSAVHGRELTIEGDEARHILRILRKKEGDVVWAVDGEGHAYEAAIRRLDAAAVQCEILSVHDRYRESDIAVTLAVAQLKNPSRMDWIVEKCTELGVHKILPMVTSRTIVKSSKEERWRHLAIAAMKQSGRCVLPQIFSPMNYQVVVDHAASYDMKLIPYELTDQALSIVEAMRYRKSVSSVLIVIGPEGGFTEEEIVQAEHADFTQVSLGRRRLRTETAAIVAVSSVIGNR